jgi:hypothetical protein
MKLKGIKISREAKILFGLMCLAAAILIWVNLATQRFPLFGGQQGVAVSAPSTPVAPAGDAATTDAALSDVTTPTPSDAALAGTTAQDATALDAAALDGTVTRDVATQDAAIGTSDIGTSDAALVETPTLDGSSQAADTAVDISAVSPDGSVVTTPGALTPTVEAPVADVTPSVAAAPIAAGDVQLAELPFLVTEAPVAPVEETSADTAAAETTRPGEQRATINPFSPIVLAPVETAAAQVGDAVAPPANDIQVVEVPDAPGSVSVVEMGLADSVNEITSEPLVAEGPLPEAVLPAPAVSSLPRPLPMASTPVAPDILRNMSRTSVSSDGSQTDVNAEPQVAEITAAVREPVQVTPATPATLSAAAASVESGEVELEPVGSMASAASAGATGANGAPLIVGASALSNYLRNNDVRFTGYAVGPVSVGIFRSNLSANPVVVTLGQTLPETEFVLTSLQGKEAEFSYGQEKQLLTLDLRR